MSELTERISRGLERMAEDLRRMETDEDYEIFDNWEIGEMAYIVKSAANIIKNSGGTGK